MRRPPGLPYATDDKGLKSRRDTDSFHRLVGEPIEHHAGQGVGHDLGPRREYELEGLRHGVPEEVLHGGQHRDPIDEVG